MSPGPTMRPAASRPSMPDTKISLAFATLTPCENTPDGRLTLSLLSVFRITRASSSPRHLVSSPRHLIDAGNDHPVVPLPRLSQRHRRVEPHLRRVAMDRSGGIERGADHRREGD